MLDETTIPFIWGMDGGASSAINGTEIPAANTAAKKVKNFAIVKNIIMFHPVLSSDVSALITTARRKIRLQIYGVKSDFPVILTKNNIAGHKIKTIFRIFQCRRRGQSFRKRNSCLWIVEEAITIVTPVIISKSPVNMRDVNCSPNITTPKKTAVTGSRAPKIAVDVDPIYCMARVVHKSDTAVGNTANATTFSQCQTDEGYFNPPLKGTYTAKSIQPKRST